MPKKYHENATVWEVLEKTVHLGVLYMDFHPRERNVAAL
jgi:Zn-dependent oligopeptidase